MKKILILIALALTTTFVSASLANQSGSVFYEYMIGQRLTDKGAWIILGKTGSDTSNAKCSMGTEWNDGSYYWYINDLIDNEVYMEFRNNSWNISDPPGKYTLRANFKYSNGSIRGDYLKYDLINKNLIFIRWLDEMVTNEMFNAIELVLVMPGTISNAIIPLTGTRKAIALLSECRNQSKKYKLLDGDRRSLGNAVPGKNI